MLIIKRECGDALRIGSDTVIRVLAVEGGKVSFEIDAPADIDVRAGDERNLHRQGQAEQPRQRSGCTGLFRRGRIRHQG